MARFKLPFDLTDAGDGTTAAGYLTASYAACADVCPQERVGENIAYFGIAQDIFFAHCRSARAGFCVARS